jgi:hypothetical protein
MGLLCIAGLVSFITSLLGCVYILGNLWMQRPVKEFVPCLILVLGVPLFVLVLEVSRRFIRFIWTMAFIYPFAVLLLSGNSFDSKSSLMFVIGTGTISLAFLAALLQYSTSLELLPIETESQGVKRDPRE